MKNQPFDNKSRAIRPIVGMVPKGVLDELPDCMDLFWINTPNRLAHFLAQCGHESGGFKRTVENLNYSSDGLRSVFARHFKPEEFDVYARQPERIANRVYANRMGNGDEASGDGWRHRGRGFIQLTGSNNQRSFFRHIGLDERSDPALISDVYPLLSAGWFWQQAGLNGICDNGTVKDVTRRVNGGFNGLKDREERYFSFLARLIPTEQREVQPII